MKKKNYLQPTCKVITFESLSILAESTGATAPDAGWGDARIRYGCLPIDDSEIDDEDFFYE